jgi:hypothetical protein
MPGLNRTVEAVERQVEAMAAEVFEVVCSAKSSYDAKWRYGNVP